jgi:glycosyltransferase involved in cell wall biosynthesis
MTNTSVAEKTFDGPLRIGFVGTLVWHKGVHVLIEAARALRGSFEVVIHGDTHVFPDYVAGLRRAAANAHVSFAGGFDRDRIEDVYRRLDVLVVPSLWPENSPLVIHEAFMQRVPVVAAGAGGISELVQDGINGMLYDPFSVESLRAALQRLVDDRGLLQSLSRRTTSVKTISVDAMEWKARYQSVLGRASEAAGA